MRNIEQTLQRLEQALAPDEPLIMVALLQFGAEPVIGWKDKNGFDCPCLPGESEEDLLASPDH
jgi:hypothetical protein